MNTKYLVVLAELKKASAISTAIARGRRKVKDWTTFGGGKLGAAEGAAKRMQYAQKRLAQMTKGKLVRTTKGKTTTGKVMQGLGKKALKKAKLYNKIVTARSG